MVILISRDQIVYVLSLCELCIDSWVIGRSWFENASRNHRRGIITDIDDQMEFFFLV